MNVTGKEMRQAYAMTVAEVWRAHPEVYALEADLSSSMGTAGLAEVMGDHYVNVGIMEAHMMSMAAGINLAGGFAYAHSFGQFLARRAMDQIFVSLAYSGLSACLVGSDSGVTAEHNGGTHMTFEDMGIVRVIPEAEIYDVCDPTQFRAVLLNARERGGLTYIRTVRKKVPVEVYRSGWGNVAEGASVLREGSDVTLFACGLEVSQALEAAELLARDGLSARVVDVFRIKPLPDELVLTCARETRAVVTCENHNVINGLGSAVAEVLAEQLPTPMWRVGVREAFGQVGTSDYLLGHYGLDSASIARAARKLLSRKG